MKCFIIFMFTIAYTKVDQETNQLKLYALKMINQDSGHQMEIGPALNHVTLEIPPVSFELSFPNQEGTFNRSLHVPVGNGETRQWLVSMTRSTVKPFKHFSFYVIASRTLNERQTGQKEFYLSLQCGIQILNSDQKTIKKLEPSRGVYGKNGYQVCCTMLPKELPTTEEIQVLITFNDEVESVGQMKKMFDEEILCDAVIKTKEKVFKCHKFMLAVKSDYFRAMFVNGMRESQENAVDWVDVFDADTVSDLLHYIYTGKVPPKIGKTVYTLTNASAVCLLPGLQDMCGRKMLKDMNVKNVVLMLQLAEKYNMAALKEGTIKFVLDNYREVTESESFKSISSEMSARLLSMFITVVGEKKLTKKPRIE